MNNKVSSGIEHRFFKTTAVSWLSTITSIAMQLIGVPICLIYWGKSNYGAWLMIFAAFTMMRTIDNGFIAYIGNRTNILFNKNIAEMQQVLSSAIYGILILGALQIIILLTLYFTNSMSLIINTNDITTITTQQIVLALMIMSINWIVVCGYIGILHRFLISVGMIYQLMWWMLLLNASQIIFVIIAAYFQVSIVMAAVLFSFSQLLVYIPSAVYIKMRLPNYFPWINNPRLDIALVELKGSTPMILNLIMQQIGSGGLVILVSAIMSITVVPIYSTLRTLTNLGVTVVNIVTAPLLPELMRFYSREDWKSLLIITQAYFILIMLIINIPIMLCYPFAFDVFTLWTKHKLSFDYSLFAFLSASVVVFSMNGLFNTFLTGINHRNYLIVSSVVRGLLVFGLSWIFMQFYGLSVVGLAILISEVLLLIINIQTFFKIELRKFGWVKQRILSWSNLIGFTAPIVFLFVSGITRKYITFGYLVTFLLLVVSIYYSWQGLDLSIKKRIINLIFRKNIK